MTGTDVRELLDLAVQELTSLSSAMVSASPPSAARITEAWPGFAATARQLLAVSVGLDTTREPLRRLALAAAHAGPRGPSTGLGETRLARSGKLLGAAADLIEPDARMAPTADRKAICVQAARIYLLGAQLTVHATLADLGCLDTAVDAATAARHAGRIIAAHPHEATSGALWRIGTTRRPEPVAGDLIGLFAVAVFDWRTAALAAARRPDVSSEDLRGAALGAGRIVAAAQVLHRAHGPVLLQKATARALDPRFSRIGRALAATATAWTTLHTGTPASPDLVRASGALQHAIVLLACDGPTWAAPRELATRASPRAAHFEPRGPRGSRRHERARQCDTVATPARPALPPGDVIRPPELGVQQPANHPMGSRNRYRLPHPDPGVRPRNNRSRRRHPGGDAAPSTSPARTDDIPGHGRPRAHRPEVRTAPAASAGAAECAVASASGVSAAGCRSGEGHPASYSSMVTLGD